MKRTVRLSVLLLVGLLVAHELTIGSKRLRRSPLGFVLAGTTPATVVTHGGLASKESMLPIAYAVADGGQTVLVADLPGHGGSHLAAGDQTRASARAWQREVDTLKVRNGIGHSLGSTFLCPNHRPNAVRVARTFHIGRGEQCPGRRGDWGRLLPIALPGVGSYHLDHLLEPWNPFIIAKAAGQPLHPRHVAYGLFPWSIFFSGLCAAVAVQRAWAMRPGIQGRTILPIRNGLGVALWLAVGFVAVSWRRLWYPFPAGAVDLVLGLTVALPPILLSWTLYRWLQGRWFSVFTALGTAAWAGGVGLVAATLHQGWPNAIVGVLYPCLVAAIVVATEGVVSLCRFPSPLARRVCHAALTAYGMVLLFPRWMPWAG